MGKLRKCRWTESLKALQVYSPELLVMRGAGGDRIGQGAGPPGCKTGGRDTGPPQSGRHCPKASEETEKEGGGHSFRAALGVSCTPDLEALPRWDVAQGGLAADRGHQGLVCLSGGRFTCVCTPPGVGSPRTRLWWGQWRKGVSHGKAQAGMKPPKGCVPAGCQGGCSPVFHWEFKVLQKGWLSGQLCVSLQSCPLCKAWQE